MAGEEREWHPVEDLMDEIEAVIDRHRTQLGLTEEQIYAAVRNRFYRSRYLIGHTQDGLCVMKSPS